jgi:hypothetical protein
VGARTSAMATEDSTYLPGWLWLKLTTNEKVTQSFNDFTIIEAFYKSNVASIVQG